MKKEQNLDLVVPNVPVAEKSEHELLMRRLIANSSLDIRCELAQSEETPENLLEFLAQDDDISVQLAVAKNENAPATALTLLAKTDDPEIKDAILMHKNTPPEVVAALTPPVESEPENLSDEARYFGGILKKIAENKLDENSLFIYLERIATALEAIAGIENKTNLKLPKASLPSQKPAPNLPAPQKALATPPVPQTAQTAQTAQKDAPTAPANLPAPKVTPVTKSPAEQPKSEPKTPAPKTPAPKADEKANLTLPEKFLEDELTSNIAANLLNATQSATQTPAPKADAKANLTSPATPATPATPVAPAQTPAQPAKTPVPADLNSEKLIKFLAKKKMAFEGFLNEKEIPGKEKNFNQLARFIGTRHKLIYPVIERFKKDIITGERSIFEFKQNEVEALNYACQLCLMLRELNFLTFYKKEKRTIIAQIARSPLFTNLINGFWLERYLCMCFQSILGRLSQKYDFAFSIYKNAEIRLKTNQKRELDIIAFVNDHAYWFECKSGEYKAYIDKYKKFAKENGFEKERSFLVLCKDEEKKSQLKEMCGDITPIFIGDLVESLEKQIVKDLEKDGARRF